MSYPGTVALCLCSSAVVLLRALAPFLSAVEPEPQPRSLPPWIWLPGMFSLVLSLIALRSSDATPNDIATAMLSAVLMLAGIWLKWSLDVLARKPPELHEATLAKALLLAPWLPLLLSRTFVASPAPRDALLWFANGFFWQTLVGDFERMFEKERVVTRRREPPDAPAGAAPSG